MNGSLEIHVNLTGRSKLEHICEFIDCLLEKYPQAKIIVDLAPGSSGRNSYV